MGKLLSDQATSQMTPNLPNGHRSPSMYNVRPRHTWVLPGAARHRASAGEGKRCPSHPPSSLYPQEGSLMTEDPFWGHVWPMMAVMMTWDSSLLSLASHLRSLPKTCKKQEAPAAPLSETVTVRCVCCHWESFCRLFPLDLHLSCDISIWSLPPFPRVLWYNPW